MALRAGTGITKPSWKAAKQVSAVILILDSNGILTMNSMLPTASRVSRALPNTFRMIASVDSISNFLKMPYLDNIIRETLGRTREASIAISLIDSVMAFGYQAYLALSQRSISPEERKRALQYAKIPLRSRGSLLRSPNTLLKFQVTLKFPPRIYAILTA